MLSTHHDYHDHNQHNRRPFALSDFVDDGDVRLTAWVVESGFYVAQVAHQRDGGDKSEGIIDEGRGEHGARQTIARVFEFFAEVDGGVFIKQSAQGLPIHKRRMSALTSSKIGRDRSENSNKRGKAKRSPSILVLEMSKGRLRRSSRAHDPDDDDEGEEAEDVEHYSKSFENGQLPNGGSVEPDGAEHKGHCKKCAVPTLDNVVAVADTDQREDLLGAHVSY